MLRCFLLLICLTGLFHAAPGLLSSLGTSSFSETSSPESTDSVVQELRKKLEQVQESLDEFQRKPQLWQEENNRISAELIQFKSEESVNLETSSSLSILENSLFGAEALQEELNRKSIELQATLKSLTQRRTQLPQLITLAREKLNSSNLNSGGGKINELIHQTLELEAMQLQMELETYDAHMENVRLKRELNLLKAEKQSRLLRQLQEAVHTKRRRQAEEDARKAEKAMEDSVNAHPMMRGLTESNQKLAEQRAGEDGLTRKIEDVSKQLDSTERKLKELKKNFLNLREKASISRMSETLGYVLRKQLQELPDSRQWERMRKDRRGLISTLQLSMMDLEDELLNTSTSREMQRFASSLGKELAPKAREKALKSFSDALILQRQLRESLLADIQLYFQKLVDLESSERELAQIVEEFRNYIYEHVLWIRSTHTIRFNDLKNLLTSVSWLIEKEHWQALYKALANEISNNLLDCLLALAIMLGVGAFQIPARKRIVQLGQTVARSHIGSFWLTIKAWSLSWFTALTRGAILFYLGHRFLSFPQAEIFTRAIGEGLQGLGIWFLLLDTLKSLSLSGGVGEKHFLWRPKGLAAIRENIFPLVYAGSACVFLYAVVASQGNTSIQDSLGRLALLILCILLTRFSFRILNQEQDPLYSWLNKLKSQNSRRLAEFFFRAFEFLFPAFGILALLGYMYTARELLLRVGMTTIIVLFVLSLEGLFKRWMLLLRRRLIAEKEARIREARENEEEETEPVPAVGESTVLEFMNLEEDSEVDISAINVQAMNLMRGVRTALILASLWAVWSDFIPALNVFGKVELWSHSQAITETVIQADGSSSSRTINQGSPVTVLDLAIALILFFLTWKAHNNIPPLLEALILRRLDLQSGQIYAISTVLSYLILALGFILSFGALGLGWGDIQWLFAAFSVGLGFGLQEIFANFVSGLILLFEQPFRVGDTVSIGNVTGVVMKIRMRATTIMDFHRQELIVPNKEFITGQLMNITLSDPTIRIDVPIGVAYGSDIQLVKKLCIEAAKSCEWTMTSPEPTILFRNFGDSSLNFQLRVFCCDYNYFSLTMDFVLCRIDELFRKHGVEVPFPQRDLTIRSAGPILEALQKAQKPGSFSEPDL